MRHDEVKRCLELAEYRLDIAREDLQVAIVAKKRKSRLSVHKLYCSWLKCIDQISRIAACKNGENNIKADGIEAGREEQMLCKNVIRNAKKQVTMACFFHCEVFSKTR